MGVGPSELAQTGGVFSDLEATIIFLFRRVVVFLSSNAIYSGSLRAGPILSKLAL